MGIRKEKFSFWLKTEQSVLLIGRVGTGKTSMIREGFADNGLKLGEQVAYYSPHERNFVGDPYEAKVILFDELNDKDAQLAAMEIFKGLWQGKPIKTKSVWGSFSLVFAEDGEVECYPDNLLLDRFSVNVEVPNRPSYDYFEKKYGDKLAKVVIEWWDELPDEEKKKVSPRRLDYTLTIRQQKGDMRDVLPITSNVSKLTTALNIGPVSEKLEALMKVNDDNATRSFLANSTNFDFAVNYIKASEPLMSYFLPFFTREQLGGLMSDDEKVCRFVVDGCNKVPFFTTVCKDILMANANNRLVKRIRREMLKSTSVAAAAYLPQKMDAGKTDEDLEG
jgi:hypothetical protein